jgi:hypothetical protein
MDNTNNFITEPTKDDLVKYLHHHEVVSYHFMKKVLNTNYYNAIVNEESWLSDFEGSGLEDEHYQVIAQEYDKKDKAGMKYAETEKLYTNIKYRYWNKLVCAKILEHYGIDIKSAKIVLYVVFDNIINSLMNNTMKNNMNIIKLENETKKFVFDENNEKIDWLKLKEHLDNKMNVKQNVKLSKEQIEEQLKTTLDPFFYAKYTGSTFVEAMDVIEDRKENQIGVYEPYRPT